MVRPGQEDHIADTLCDTFWTDLTWAEVLSVVLLFLDLRWDLGTFVCERIVQSHLAGMSPSEILSKVTQLMEIFTEARQRE